MKAAAQANGPTRGKRATPRTLSAYDVFSQKKSCCMIFNENRLRELNPSLLTIHMKDINHVFCSEGVINGCLQLKKIMLYECAKYSHMLMIHMKD